MYPLPITTTATFESGSATRRLSATLATVAAICVATAIFGVLLGYRTPGPFATFIIFAGIVGVAAWRIASSQAADDVDRAIRAATAAFAIIVVCGFILGVTRGLTKTGYVIAESVALAGVFVLFPAEQSSTSAGENGQSESGLSRSTLAVAGFVTALLGFALAYGITHAPLTLYDSVSYHLYFSARWLQDHALSILPTPFSDEAQAYAPANGELYFLWLMMPFHGDLLARIGQLPFALLGATTVYALARRIGAPKEHAIYPAAFFLLSRPVLEQAIGANVDLICAAMFLVALYLGIDAVEHNRPRDWIWWGVAVGLYAGTKYVALVYVPVLLGAALARGIRPRMLWAAPGIALFAIPWYLRNWFVAGSPIYPATLKIAGITLAHGAFTREAMLNTVFHTTNIRLFPAIAAHGLGPTLALVWIPFAAVGIIRMARVGWWPHRVFVLVPLVMVPLYWYGFPVNIDSRFLMPALAPALLPFAFTFRENRGWNAVIHGAMWLAMLWIVFGVHAEIPARLPWFMGGWLALDGLLASPFVVPFLVAATIVVISFVALAPLRRHPIAAAVCASTIGGAVLAVGAGSWCGPATCDYLDTTSPYIRSNLLSAWTWIDDNLTNGTVAYTGINLPYPLSGNRLTNRVVYVNIDGHPRWRFHDYDRAIRSGRFHEPASPLATPSGELLPVAAHPGAHDDAARPRYERMAGSKEAWIGNLAVLGVTHVFVAALSAYEIDCLWHNERGFPIEDQWAASEPDLFRLVYENPQVHVYAVNLTTRNRA